MPHNKLIWSKAKHQVRRIGHVRFRNGYIPTQHDCVVQDGNSFMFAKCPRKMRIFWVLVQDARYGKQNDWHVVGPGAIIKFPTAIVNTPYVWDGSAIVPITWTTAAVNTFPEVIWVGLYNGAILLTHNHLNALGSMYNQNVVNSRYDGNIAVVDSSYREYNPVPDMQFTDDTTVNTQGLHDGIGH